MMMMIVMMMMMMMMIGPRLEPRVSHTRDGGRLLPLDPRDSVPLNRQGNVKHNAMLNTKSVPRYE